MIEIFIYSFISNLVFYSYGHFIRYSNFSNKIENINDRSILGCILISFTALVLNFFLPLGKELNTFILIIGITYLLIIRKLKYKKKEFFYILLSSVITSSLILYSNINRPDGGLYHLPYISYLNEHKLIFGLSNIHFRFGMTSILQYLSAANFNLIFKEIGIVIPLASVVTFFIIYFFNKVLKILKNTKNISYSNIFSLFIIIFIAYKINRYSSFGNDAVAHLSLFYLLSKILSKEKPNLVFISLIAVFGFLNKTTLIIILLIPLYFFLKNLNIKKIYCYEPHKIFIKNLINYKKKNNKIIIKKFGISNINKKITIFYPSVNFLGFNLPILTYTFYNKSELKKQLKLDFYNHKKIKIYKSEINLKKFKLINKKINLIKIDVNGFELEVVKGILPQIIKDKPLLVIENNSSLNKIFLLLKKYKYKKFYNMSSVFKEHKNQKALDIFFIPKKIK